MKRTDAPISLETNASNLLRDEFKIRAVRLPHAVEPDAVAVVLEVDPDIGLSNEEAARRLLRDGANVLKTESGRRWWRILLEQFSSVVIWLLLIAAIVALFTKGALESSAIFIVLVLNAAIGFAIEWKAGRALDALSRKSKTTARVRRNRTEQIIDAAGLAVGDIVALSAGDRVPADARLIEAFNLRADESAMTGESEAVEKSVAAVELSSLLAERRSMLYLGTTIVSGRALAIVTATGARTELGRIGRLIAETETEKTPLEQRLEGLGKRLALIVPVIAFIVLLAGALRGDELMLMLEVAISLAVAAVPEALPAVTTLILALGVLRMARRRAIVRRLSAVETLGSTTVICTDKTGTLTENRMTVQEFRLADDQKTAVTDFKSRSLKNFFSGNLDRLLRVGVMCNEASFDREAIGDPTETALLVGAAELGFKINSERAHFEKILEQPFDAVTKRMLVVGRDTRNGVCRAMMKGAPSVVLSACTRFADANGENQSLDDETRRRFYILNEAMASRALRVLAFAEKPVDEENPNEIESGFVFLGFAGMSDPPRPGVAQAIREAHEAGIRVVMLTGDQIKTAESIAAELNLSEGSDVCALHAREMANADREQLAELAKRAYVFARVSPEDKLRIVEALQQAGEIVAVTGDGINDAPALKKADIGIAMGERGTEVAKEAADVVLADDNFATIVKAVESGRTIYANIIKFVHLMFAKNLAAVLFIFAAILFGLPLPLLPLQILWLNLVTDVFPAFALALEPATKGTMKRRPRAPGEALLSNSFLLLIIWQAVLLGAVTLAAYLWALQNYGESAHSRTVALLALVGVQIGHLFNCRSRTRSAFEGFWRNPFVFAAAGIMILLQLLAINFAPLAQVLEIVQPAAADWLIAGLCVLLPILIVETTKVFARRKN